MPISGRRRLSIIIPSFNDARIVRAIESVRAFDDAGETCIIVVDGGSKPELVSTISSMLTNDDVMISEPDRGIFDALNKGLAASDTEYIGWIGSDDYFSGLLKSTEVIESLATCDLFVANTAMVRGATVARITHSWPSRFNLARFGLHNPHFSTFGRANLLKREKFSLELRGADIDYFLRIFGHDPLVRTSSKVSTLQEVGGFSNSSYKAILRTNAELYRVYKSFLPAPLAGLALILKLGYKISMSSYARLRPNYRVKKFMSRSRMLRRA